MKRNKIVLSVLLLIAFMLSLTLPGCSMRSNRTLYQSVNTPYQGNTPYQDNTAYQDNIASQDKNSQISTADSTQDLYAPQEDGLFILEDAPSVKAPSASEFDLYDYARGLAGSYPNHQVIDVEVDGWTARYTLKMKTRSAANDNDIIDFTNIEGVVILVFNEYTAAWEYYDFLYTKWEYETHLEILEEAAKWRLSLTHGKMDLRFTNVSEAGCTVEWELLPDPTGYVLLFINDENSGIAECTFEPIYLEKNSSDEPDRLNGWLINGIKLDDVTPLPGGGTIIDNMYFLIDRHYPFAGFSRNNTTVGSVPLMRYEN